MSGTSALRGTRRGMTLIEMLVGVTITLIMMFAIVQIFQLLGENIRSSRSIIEMNSQLRQVSLRLQDDLDMVTVPVRPMGPNDEPMGYFLYREGPGNDILMPDGTTTWITNGSTTHGDIDDILMFTARSKGQPFVGLYNGVMIESPLAEIVWWVTHDSTDRNNNSRYDLGEDITVLHRRVLLIRPDLTPSLPTDDLSVSPDTGNSNSLADLSRPENRFAHSITGVTLGGNIEVKTIGPPASLPLLIGDRLGEDIILSDALAFDVQAYDPGVNVHGEGTGATGVALVPSDPGYIASTTELGFGAFVDLGNGAPAATQTLTLEPFAGRGITTSNYLPTYDTWSYHFEQVPPAPAVNGLDDGGEAGVVDDAGERIAPPPYPYPLRGVKVSIRMIEPTTAQVRQTSAIGNFVAE